MCVRQKGADKGGHCKRAGGGDNLKTDTSWWPFPENLAHQLELCGEHPRHEGLPVAEEADVDHFRTLHQGSHLTGSMNRVKHLERGREGQTQRRKTTSKEAQRQVKTPRRSERGHARERENEGNTVCPARRVGAGRRFC